MTRLRQSVRISLVAGVVTALAACGSSVATRTYIVPSPSMLPTLKLGQRGVVALDPHYQPKVGDIVVLHPPSGVDAAEAVCGDAGAGVGHSQACDRPARKQSSQTSIKRIVAAPGDTIKFIHGHVYRNGQRENDSAYTEPCGGRPYCSFPRPITIPSGDYFVLGDNRGESDDSRFWGPVPGAWIIGKVRSAGP